MLLMIFSEVDRESRSNRRKPEPIRTIRDATRLFTKLLNY